jgi:hypothetical protein
MDLSITPYTGVGPLRLGLAPEEIHAVLGAPRVRRPQGSKLREMYADGIACTYEGAPDRLGLVEIGFAKAVRELDYAGVRLFQVPRQEALRRLVQDDPDVAEALGFLIFLRLGIATNGFHTAQEEDLAVTVFARGRWDAHRPTMRPFRLSG